MPGTRPKNLLNWVLSSALLGIFIAFFQIEAFFDWAFERHQNILSWWIRPMMILPFAAAAWWRSWTGIWLALIALFTSMFWFPVPDAPDPEVLAFLQMERDLLSSGWTTANILATLAILGYGTLMGAAIWHRSLALAIGVIALGGLAKSAWSLAYSPDTGGTVLPIALLGTAIAAGIAYVLFTRNNS